MTKNEKIFIKKALDILDEMETKNMSDKDYNLWTTATLIIDKALRGEDR